ncbi:hypothetical protein ABMY26_33820 [Azospirillum sp. HJ39]|uniref:hypothetical protein n=1 Tax=Azospirillum sp. HJ39 TaxID=3159496 RepID=UPI003557BA26
MLKIKKIYGIVDSVGNSIIKGNMTKFYHISFRKEDGSIETINNIEACGPPLSFIQPGVWGTWYLWRGTVIGMRSEDGTLRDAVGDAVATYWLWFTLAFLVTSLTLVIPAIMLVCALIDRPTPSRVRALMTV